MMLIRKFVTRRILRVLALAAVLFAFHSSPAKAVTNVLIENGLLNSGENAGDMSSLVMTEANITLALTFDYYPSDITVTITNSLEEIVYSGGPYDQNLQNSTTTVSLSLECGSDYNLAVMDSYGDGGTSWSLYVSDNSEEVLSSGVADGYGVAENAFDIVCGCTDAESCNYNADAVADDGTCFSGAGATFCYGDNLTSVSMGSVQVGGDTPLLLTFTAGFVEQHYDQIYVYDGMDITTSNELWMEGEQGGPTSNLNLSGIQVTSLSGVINIVMSSDGSVSCGYGSFAGIAWSVDCVAVGCMDPSACNYDSNAEVSDDSCSFAETGYNCDGECLTDTDGDGTCDDFEIAGCLEMMACNYSMEATDDDGSCTYAAQYYDCWENCLSDIDLDGVCDELEVDGCDEEMACNYNQQATENDGSCLFPMPFYDCDENCLNDVDGDSICDELEIVGCQDINACNYNSSATDSGDCSFVMATCDTCSGQTDGSGMVIVNDIDGDGVCDADEVPGCQDEGSLNFNEDATDSDGSCLYPNCVWNDSFCYNDGMVMESMGFAVAPEGESILLTFQAGLLEEHYDQIYVYDGMDIATSNVLWAEGLPGDGFGQLYLGGVEVHSPSGVINIVMSSDASVSCGYNTPGFTTGIEWSTVCGVEGCMDSQACNYNMNANVENGSCGYEAITVTINQDNYSSDENTWDFSNDAGDVVASGTFNSAEVCLVAGCYSFSMYDSYGDGMCCNYGVGSYLVEDANGVALASGGEFTFEESTSFCLPAFPGCTDNVACNYNPDANLDDGTCEYPGVRDCDNVCYADEDGDNLCDFSEDNCSDLTACNWDNDIHGNFGCIYPVFLFLDEDGDGFGDSDNAHPNSCLQGGVAEGYVANAEDCDDSDAEITVATIWYLDADGDGTGVAEVSVEACFQPDGYVAVFGDICPDDADKLLPAVCGCGIVDQDLDEDGICDVDSVDEDSLADDNCADPDACNFDDVNNVPCVLPIVYFADADADGLGDEDSTQSACSQPEGYVLDSSDLCDDLTACNYDDANNEPCIAAPAWYLDADGDGLGSMTDSLSCATSLDGYVQNNNDWCDDLTAINFGDNPTTFCEYDNSDYTADLDGDGYGDTLTVWTGFIPPNGYILQSTSLGHDCDDSDALIAIVVWYLDGDGDGYGHALSDSIVCEQPVGYVSNSDDLCPTDASKMVGGICGCGSVDVDVDEDAICDTQDNCMDTSACNYDEASNLPCLFPITYFLDHDGDGLGDPLEEYPNPCSLSAAPDGYVANNTDCDDTDDSIGAISTWYYDSDGDGLGNPDSTHVSCVAPSGYVDNGDDVCLDSTTNINIDGDAICDNDDEDNCTDVTACNFDDPGNGACVSSQLYFLDADGDGLGSLPDSLRNCYTVAGYVLDSSDLCDDLTACNYGDDANLDCVFPQIFYQDLDGDGHGNAAVSAGDCSGDGLEGYVSIADDACDDLEACNYAFVQFENAACAYQNTFYVDNDGDGLGDGTASSLDECANSYSGYVLNNEDLCDDVFACNYSDENNEDCIYGTVFYVDIDGDGLGLASESGTYCDQPYGYVANNLDNCEDLLACNYDDEDNAECIESEMWYLDFDGDGLGNSEVQIALCDEIEGYVQNSTDGCDNPNACNYADATAETCVLPTVWYLDADGDGLGWNLLDSTACTEPVGYSANNEDSCDDVSACNYDAEENYPCYFPTVWFVDADGDGFGNPFEGETLCTDPGEGYTTMGMDCDDSDAESAVTMTMYFYDGDGDGLGDPNSPLLGCTQMAGYVENSYDSCPGDPDNLDIDGDEVCDELDNCTNTEACNFNDVSNEACEFPSNPGYDCEGNCVSDADSDGVCDEFEVAGCQDESACDYNSEATDEDGSCTYAEQGYDCNGNCLADTDGNGICDGNEVAGCLDATACNFNEFATFSDGSCAHEILSVNIVQDNYPSETTWTVFDEAGESLVSGDVSGGEVCVAEGCYNFTFYDSYGDGICCAYGEGSYALVHSNGATLASGGDFDSEETTSFCLPLTLGCTDSTACNYDTDADSDDGSCAFNLVSVSINHDNWAHEVSWGIGFEGEDFVASESYSSADDNSTTTDDVCLSEGCYVFLITDTYGDGIIGGGEVYTVTDANEYALVSGDGTYGTSDASAFCVPTISGCMDEFACNYDSNADADDGSCIPDIDGDEICDENDLCTDITACNYNDPANGACVSVPTYYLDSDNDGWGDPDTADSSNCYPLEGYVSNGLDQCPNDALKFAPGACGCDVIDVDTDEDGICDLDNEDLCTNTAACNFADPANTPCYDDNTVFDITTLTLEVNWSVDSNSDKISLSTDPCTMDEVLTPEATNSALTNTLEIPFGSTSTFEFISGDDAGFYQASSASYSAPIATSESGSDEQVSEYFVYSNYLSGSNEPAQDTYRWATHKFAIPQAERVLFQAGGNNLSVSSTSVPTNEGHQYYNENYSTSIWNSNCNSCAAAYSSNIPLYVDGPLNATPEYSALWKRDEGGQSFMQFNELLNSMGHLNGGSGYGVANQNVFFPENSWNVRVKKYNWYNQSTSNTYPLNTCSSWWLFGTYYQCGTGALQSTGLRNGSYAKTSLLVNGGAGRALVVERATAASTAWSTQTFNPVNSLLEQAVPLDNDFLSLKGSGKAYGAEVNYSTVSQAIYSGGDANAGFNHSISRHEINGHAFVTPAKGVRTFSSMAGGGSASFASNAAGTSIDPVLDGDLCSDVNPSLRVDLWSELSGQLVATQFLYQNPDASWNVLALPQTSLSAGNQTINIDLCEAGISNSFVLNSNANQAIALELQDLSDDGQVYLEGWSLEIKDGTSEVNLEFPAIPEDVVAELFFGTSYMMGVNLANTNANEVISNAVLSYTVANGTTYSSSLSNIGNGSWNIDVPAAFYGVQWVENEGEWTISHNQSNSTAGSTRTWSFQFGLSTVLFDACATSSTPIPFAYRITTDEFPGYTDDWCAPYAMDVASAQPFSLFDTKTSSITVPELTSHSLRITGGTHLSHMRNLNATWEAFDVENDKYMIGVPIAWPEQHAVTNPQIEVIDQVTIKKNESDPVIEISMRDGNMGAPGPGEIDVDVPFQSLMIPIRIKDFDGAIELDDVSVFMGDIAPSGQAIGSYSSGDLYLVNQVSNPENFGNWLEGAGNRAVSTIDIDVSNVNINDVTAPGLYGVSEVSSTLDAYSSEWSRRSLSQDRGTVTAATISGYSYLGSSDSSFYYLSNSSSNWASAQISAENLGGHLATFESAAENELVTTLVNSNQYPWIGLYQNATSDEPNGNWQWVTGQEISLNDASSGGCSEVTLTLLTDNFPHETTWSIRDASNNVVLSGGPYGASNAVQTQSVCLINGCYTFNISDSYGDGICCAHGEGNYTLTDELGSVLASGGNFQSSETSNFCIEAWSPFANWHQNEPNNSSSSEHRAHLYSGTNVFGRTWNDASASGQKQHLLEIAISSETEVVIHSGNADVESPGWYLGPIDYAGLIDSLSDGNFSSTDYRNPGDLFCANELAAKVKSVPADNVMEYSFQIDESNWNQSRIHCAFPLTPANAPADAFDGAAALENNLPYWGIPNGVNAYGEVFVRLTNGNNTFSKLITSVNDPFLKHDAPYLQNDSLVFDLILEEFVDDLVLTAGQTIQIEAVALWATPGRRVLAADLGDNPQVMCGVPIPVSLTSFEQEVQSSGANATVSFSWSEPLGGEVTIQRQFPESTTSTNWVDLTSFDVGAVTEYADATLGLDSLLCDDVSYRLKIELCDATTYSPVDGVIIQGDVDDPWENLVSLNQSIYADKGFFKDQVNVDWSAVQDSSEAYGIDAYRLERRVYQPAEQAPEDDWIVLFNSSEDWQFTDFTANAGVLYEYRVQAIVSCGAGNYVEFASPYAVGYRTAVGEVSGQVTFGTGTAVKDVDVVVTKTTGGDPRLVAKLPEDIFVGLNTDLLKDTLATGYLMSQWMRIDEDLTTSPTPLLSWWTDEGLDDAGNELVSEIISLQISKTDTVLHTNLFRAGDVLTQVDIVPYENDYSFFAIEVITHEDGMTSDSLIVSCLTGEILQVDSVRLGINLYEEFSLLKSIEWAAAQGLISGCLDEGATNFITYAMMSTSCAYADEHGCTDPLALNYNVDAGVNDGSCDFGNQMSEAIRLNWFSDQDLEEYPVVLNAQNEVVWSGQNLPPVTGALAPFQPASYRFALTDGEYEVQVWRGDGVEANDFGGNMSVYNEDGSLIMGTSQYLSWEILSQPPYSYAANPYAFTVNPQNCAEVGQPVSGVALSLDGSDAPVVDCASCYSWSFDEETQAKVELSGISNLGTQYSLALWMQANYSSISPDDFERYTVFSLGGTEADPDLEVFIRNGELQAVLGEDSMVVVHPLLDGVEENVNDLQPMTWYHVTLVVDGSSIKLTARPSFYDANEEQLWRAELVGEDDDWGYNWQDANLYLGGGATSSGGFSGLIHGFALWDGVISSDVQNALFNGPESAVGDPVWVSTAVSSDLIFNRLVPTAMVDDPEIENDVTVTSSKMRSVLRSPNGECLAGCNRLYGTYGQNGALTYESNDFNPFVNIFEGCYMLDMVNEGLVVPTSAKATTRMTLDEIRLWTDEIVSTEGDTLQGDSLAWASFNRYIAYDSDGLLNYLEFDEAVGNRTYDRSKEVSSGVWNKNHAIFYESQGNVVIEAPETGLYFDPSEPPQLQNKGKTTVDGQYRVDNIKYTGTGNTFKVDPDKGIHLFAPSQLYLSIGDIQPTQANINFTDLSSFEQNIQVFYQDLDTTGFEADAMGDYLGTTFNYLEHGRGNASSLLDGPNCPARGVSVAVDGVPFLDGDNNILLTDARGMLTVTVPIGTHTLTVSKVGHTFVNDGNIELTIVEDRIAAGDELTFWDTSTGKAAGLINGSQASVDAEWGTTQNNIGFAKFFLFPVDTTFTGAGTAEWAPDWIEGTQYVISADDYLTRNQTPYFPLKGCPAIPVQTDETGRYFADVIPETYVIGKMGEAPFDNSRIAQDYEGYLDAPNDDDFGSIVVLNNSPYALENNPLSTGEYWYQSASEAAVLNLKTDMATDLDTSSVATEELPDGVGAMANIIFNAPPTVMTWQDPMGGAVDGVMTCVPLTSLPESPLSFIGMEVMEKMVAGQRYNYNFRNHWNTAGTVGQSPLPFGNPIVEEFSLYCMGMAPVEVYTSEYGYGGESYSYENRAISGNQNLVLQVEENIGSGGSQPIISKIAVEGVPLSYLIFPQVKYTDDQTRADGYLEIQITDTAGGNTHAIEDAWEVYTSEELPLIQSVNADVVQYNRMRMLIVGDAVRAADFPVSTLNQLDMILRDPPGDGSSTTLESGSSKSSNKTSNTSHAFDGSTNVTAHFGADLSFGISAGGFAGLGAGVTFGASFDTDISTTADITLGLLYGGETSYSSGVTETMVFNQSLTTSGDEQDGSGGANQDIYFGRTENVFMTEKAYFGLETTTQRGADTVDGLTVTVPFARVGDNAAQDATKPISLGWKTMVSIETGPASYFVKTALEIEQYNIPNLITLRDAYFDEHSEPGGLYTPLTSNQLEDVVPEGMFLANNDDPRWLLFHKNFIDEKYPSTPSSLDLPLNRLVYEDSEKNGPGYNFNGTLGQDTVRLYNDLINSWTRMLAQNELDKLNARAAIADDIDQYDELSEIYDPSIFELAEDNGYAIESVGQLSAEGVYASFDFEPYFMIFSGGGNEYTQSYTKTSLEGRSDVSLGYFGGKIGGEVGFEIKGLGMTATTELSNTNTWTTTTTTEDEASLTFSYTLMDDDEDDFQFVAVMPGQGADGPIFLNLGAAPSSCPWDAGEESKYEEFYPFLSNEIERMLLQETLCPSDEGVLLHALVTFTDNHVENIYTAFATQTAANAFQANAVADWNASSIVWSPSVIDLSNGSGSWNIHSSICAAVPTDGSEGVPAVVQPAQYMLDAVELTTANEVYSFNGNINDPLIVNLQVNHLSNFTNGTDYVLSISPTGNPLAASISMAGGGSSVNLVSVTADNPVVIPVSITANGLTQQEYLSGTLVFSVESACDGQISSEIELEVTFDPVCSPIELTSPEAGWFVNTNQIVSSSGSGLSALGEDSELQFRVDGLNMRLQNFCANSSQPGCGSEPHAVELQVLRSNSVVSGDVGWQTFRTITRDQIEVPGSNLIGFIDTSFVYTDVFGPVSPFEDPAVQFRALAVCELYQETVSNVAEGAIDKVRPGVFGDALPLDGVYDPNDEFMIRFNEAMNPVSVGPVDISIEGDFNGLNPWAGAIGFDADEYLSVIDAPNLMDNDWYLTLQVWPEGEGETVEPLEGTIFYQGDESHYLKIFFTESNVVKATVHTNSITTTETIGNVGEWLPGRWNTLKLGSVWQQNDDDGNPEHRLFVGTPDNPQSYVFTLPEGMSSPMYVGNAIDGSEPFNALVKDLRMWQDNWAIPGSSSSDISPNPEQNRLTGLETGLSLWIPSTEMEGTPTDFARGRTIQFNAHWELAEGGFALSPSSNATALSLDLSTSSVASMSLEFWFKPSELGVEQTMLSNNTTWFFQVGADGHFEVLYISDIDGQTAYYSPFALENKWYHVAVVGEDGGTVRTYLDGEEIFSLEPDDRFALTSLYLDGGSVLSTTGASFTGYLDEIRVWTKSLNPDEIMLRRHKRLGALPGVLAYAAFDSLGVDGVAVSNLQYLKRNGQGVYENKDLTTGTTLSNESYAFIPLESTAVEEAAVLSISHNAGNDEFILEFKEDKLWKFEDQVVQVTLEQTVSDVIGNDMAAPDTWKFLFDQHPLKIDLDAWDVECFVGDAPSTTFTLFNTGLELEDYSLTDLPVWLEASPESGSLAPFGSVEITLSLADDISLGEYGADFRITGDFCSESNPMEPDFWCFGERFHVDAKVRAEEPELEVDLWNFEQSMSVVSRVYNGPYASYDDEDIVMAYVDGELRGYGRLNVDVSNQLYAFVDVFFDAEEATADNGEGLPVDFHVWDASRGVTFTNAEMYHPTLLDTLEAVRVQPDAIYGEVFAPLLLKTTNRVEQEINLTPGWNWISFNVKSDSLKSIPAAFSEIPTADILEVKNQTQVAQTYNGEWALISNADSLGLDDMFQVKMRTTVPSDTVWTMNLQGPIPDRIADAQSVVKGWNALGYMAQRELSVGAALQSLWDADSVLTVNDVVKSRYDGFAMYAGGGDWFGSLTHMTPGQGYKLQLMRADAAAGDTIGVLHYPVDAMTAGYEYRAATPKPDVWPEDFQSLESSHNLVVSLDLPDYVPQTMDDVVGVFSFDEVSQAWQCVGQAYPRDFFGHRRYFVTAFGRAIETGTPLQFRWYSGFTDGAMEAREVELFAPDGMTGTMDEPLELHFRVGDGIASEASAFESAVSAREGDVLEVYPNPMTSSFTLHYRGTEIVEQIRLEDATGKLVRLLDCSQLQRMDDGSDAVREAVCTWEVSNLNNGVYFIHLVTDQGAQRVRILKM